MWCMKECELFIKYGWLSLSTANCAYECDNSNWYFPANSIRNSCNVGKLHCSSSVTHLRVTTKMGVDQVLHAVSIRALSQSSLLNLSFTGAFHMFDTSIGVSCNAHVGFVSLTAGIVIFECTCMFLSKLIWT